MRSIHSSLTRPTALRISCAWPVAIALCLLSIPTLASNSVQAAESGTVQRAAFSESEAPPPPAVSGAVQLAQANTVCPPAVTGCTAAEHPYALCEGYHGWLAAVAGMRGQSFCIVNKDADTDGSVQQHFAENCKKLTPCTPAQSGPQPNQPTGEAGVPAGWPPKPVCQKGSSAVPTSEKITRMVNGQPLEMDRKSWKCVKAKAPSKTNKTKPGIEAPPGQLPQYPTEEPRQ